MCGLNSNTTAHFLHVFGWSCKHLMTSPHNIITISTYLYFFYFIFFSNKVKKIHVNEIITEFIRTKADVAFANVAEFNKTKTNNIL